MGSCCITQGTQLSALWQPSGVGWGGRWEEGSRGREHVLYLWLIHVDVWQKPIQHCKVIILQVKINKKFKNYQFLPISEKILLWNTFHIHWYWWGLGRLLGVIPDCVHMWGFRHTGMECRSQQTLNCKGDEYLRTWKKKEDTTGKGGQAMVRLTQQRGWGLEGISISLVTVFHCVLTLPMPSLPGNVYVDWGRRDCACLAPGDLRTCVALREWATGLETGELWHLGRQLRASGCGEHWRWVVTGAGWWAWYWSPWGGIWGVRLEF